MNELMQFCTTDRQREILQAVIDTGSQRAAAKALGCANSSVDAQIQKLKRRAAQMGWAPEHDLVHPVPAGLAIKGTSIRYDADGGIQQYWNKSKQAGRLPEDTVQLPDPKTVEKVSTLYDQMGNVTQQWVSEKPERAAQVLRMKEFADELAKELPRIDPVKKVAGPYSKHLAACYPVGDHHFGMLSWEPETGEDYDLDIAASLLKGAFDHLIKSVPKCDQSYVVFLGDLLHYDSFETVTPTSRNALDADGRFPKMVEVACRSIRYAINAALRHHSRVTVIVETGNHDISATVWIQTLLAAVYEKEPRVKINTSPSHFHYFTHGSTLVGIHHGHGVRKMEKLPLIMATDRPAEWGRSQHRYWWTGHVHHDQAKDYEGCKVESFRVLPPQDAYAAQNGYRSMSDMKAIVLHEEYGEIARHTFNPAMLEK